MTAAAVIFDVKNAGAKDALDVDAGMLIEILVLSGNEGIGDKLRDGLDRQVEPPLLGIFRKQRAVGGMHPRHHRRLIVLELRIVRQILGVMPQQAGDARHPAMKKTVPAANRKPKKRSSNLTAIPSRPTSLSRIHCASAAPRTGALAKTTQPRTAWPSSVPVLAETR